MKNQKINLENYIGDGSKVLSGRNDGIAAREKENLNEFDSIAELTCTVVIPNQLWSLNSSFFLGLFGPSVRSLGEENFRKKYIFDYNGNQEIQNDIEQGIKDAKSEADSN